MSVKKVKEEQNIKGKRIRVVYGDEVTVLPLSAADAAERASGLDCKILWYLLSDPDAREGSHEALLSFSKQIGTSLDDVERAIAYWRGVGVIELLPEKYSEKKKDARKGTGETKSLDRKFPAASCGEKAEKTESDTNVSRVSAEKGRKLRGADELPNYTMTELSELLEKRKDLSLFIDECQRAFGRMFNPRDIGKIIGMIDHLGLSEEYILTLLHYFGELPEEERKPLHYAERMAFSLTDDGITDPMALREYLDRLRLLRSNEGQIRTIFGMGARAFTAKEKKAVMLWLGEYGSSMELIRIAYEKTVNATGKASVPYASKILERWYREGLTTPEAVEKAEREDGKGKEDNENFDTDDFFEAALRRSYGEAYEQLYRDKGKSEQ